jgi:hypothetical protein
MLSRWAIVAAVAVLAGCAKPLEVSSITDVRSKTGSKSIDVYEPKRQAGLPGVPEFAGDQLVEVRTYVDKEGSARAEVAGATCELSAADFSATLQTPARVRVPIYRAQSSALAVSCQMPGYRKTMITVTAFDATRSGRMAGGSGSVVGLIAVAAIDAMADNSKNEWRYPVAGVVLEPEAAKTARN